MKKTLIIVVLIYMFFIAGCTSTKPKGAIPYILSGGEKEYASVHQIEHPEAIILLEFDF